MIDPVLGDYARGRSRYKDAMIDVVPCIVGFVFQCTLEMITKNFEDYPKHRLKFFSLLQAIATHCFQALILVSPEAFASYSVIPHSQHVTIKFAPRCISIDLFAAALNFEASKNSNKSFVGLPICRF
ncbi:hypothetical protein L1987_64945 [Smallanthus sonchifolius]|uniref:Uncharacterized protein n=1 Tax=Smallanthus sonchifolius TaxID=185202 RepID=A0ACB9BT41_9ASTR|nr:hypothetical protein L1987_64945 [Smallanthus sonchifolius]